MISIPHRLRVAALGVVGLACALVALFAVHQLVFPVVAWVFPSLYPTFYDLAVYGAYPQRHYVSHNLTSPDLLQLQWDDQCDDGYVFFSPQGESVKNPGPMILDARGNLVWQSDQYGKAMNLKVQKYKGEDYLTFWAGHRGSTFGFGNYYMLNASYQEVYQVSAVGEGYKGDLHEFQLTNDGTALLTVYNVTQADMTAMGRPVDGWINNCMFQEVDVETGELLFEWSALDHFGVADSFMTHPWAGYWESVPFDFFHINSVQKDSKGDFLVSSRHLHSLIKIDGRSGEVVWSLGGAHNDFEDLSDGKATDFKWQHDGRMVSEEEGIVTLFDNSDAGPLHLDAPYSTGRMIQIDVEKKTAKLLHTYVSAKYTRAASQGSVEVLPGSNNVFIGWGHSPVYSEFTNDGKLLCEAHYGAQFISQLSHVTSYRSLKNAEWVGTPTHSPNAKILDGNLFVSWLGSTKVVQWTLQGSTSEKPAEFTDVDVADKVGFETSFTLPKDQHYTNYRVAALDNEGNILQHSDIAVRESARSIWRFLLPFCIFMGAAFGVWFVYKHRQGKLMGWRSYKYSPL